MDDEEGHAPAEPTPPPASIVKLSLFIIRAMLGHRVLLAACLLASLGVAVATAAFASLLVPFVQIVSGRPPRLGNGSPFGFLIPFFQGLTPVGQFQALAVGILLVAIVRAVFSYADSRSSSFMAVIIERDLRQRVFDEILQTDLRALNKERTANLYAILHTYPRQASNIADQFLGSLTKGLAFAAVVFTLLFVSWQLTLIAAVMGISATLLVTRIRVLVRRLGRKINVQRVRLNQVSLEALQAMKLIRLFNREEHTRQTFLGTVRTLQGQSYRRASLQALAPQLQRIVTMALFAGLIFAATLILPGQDPEWVGVLAAFILVVNQLQTPMSSVAKQQSRILSDMPAVEEIVEFLERPKPKMKDGTETFTRLSSAIRFEDVTFSYDEGGERVLRDVTFDVPRGRMVALVGASGSGKSTIVQLVARLADPTLGRVTVDGVDLRRLRVGTWRSRLAVVSQDTFLFNTTVRENIRFGRLDATDADVERAARLAEAHEFIGELEDAYDTNVGDRGVRLSGGQAQRIAIARALLADPDLLILDEATSALDTATERSVQRAIERASRDRTVLAIAHRLSTIRNADVILVLERGRIVERGTHDELMAKRGHYFAYVEMQEVKRDDAAPAGPAPPAPIVRLVFGPDAGEATAIDAGGRAHAVQLHARNGSTPAGDVAELVAGASEARVVVLGRAHEGVPIFQRHPDGREVRCRVRSLHAPAPSA